MRTLIILFALLPILNLFIATSATTVKKEAEQEKTTTKKEVVEQEVTREIVYEHNFDGYTLVIPGFVADADLSQDPLSDTIYIQEELGAPLDIQQAFLLAIEGDEQAEISVEQAFRTSLTISDEGPFVTLENWKHHRSDWTKLEKTDGKFQTLTYENEDRAKFPIVALGAFKEYVKMTYGARWYEVIKENQQVADNGSYPAYIDITDHYFRIKITTPNGLRMERIVAIKLAQGC